MIFQREIRRHLGRINQIIHGKRKRRLHFAAQCQNAHPLLLYGNRFRHISTGTAENLHGSRRDTGDRIIGRTENLSFIVKQSGNTFMTFIKAKASACL